MNSILRSMLILAIVLAIPFGVEAQSRPNIIWVVVEDASPHIGCYGETVIKTPYLNQMAADGVKFENAFVTCPVCSPSRSAMVSGMFQTTLGSHNHRSCNLQSKANGNVDYYDSYRVPESIRLVPELFTDAGYYVVNGGKGKTDYNFIERSELYRGKDWKDRDPNQPFFAQIQLSGGKNRGAKIDRPTDPADVTLPPYYPDDPQLREDWAQYLNSWVYVDNEMGKLFERLEAEGIADSTVVFFWTDHGISHLRGKQFLYEEGIRVPMIVKFPHHKRAGTVRTDLVSHIDVAAASLQLAGIPIPDYIQGRPIFAEDYQPRQRIFAARDRCDETSETIRCVRTDRFKYIRNFISWRPHLQPNRYKDGKQISQTMRRLHAEGKLNELQARVFQPTRPMEEFYDLDADPHETVNLAGNPEFRETLLQLRRALYTGMVKSRDVGLIPEPILEDLGRQYGSKYAVLKQPENEGLIREAIETIHKGERRNIDALVEALESPRPTIRYWAATWLGNSQEPSVAQRLQESLKDENATVRVAAALALCKLGEAEAGLPTLQKEIENPNLLVGLYAIRGLEEIGPAADPALPAIQHARQSAYDPTSRVAVRLTAQLGNGAP